MALERKRSSRRSNNYRGYGGPGGPGGGGRAPKSTGARCKQCCRRFTAFMFSHVGLCGLVVGYAVMGALAFRALETEHDRDRATDVREKRELVVQELWQITNDLNILYRENWTQLVSVKIRSFQAQIIEAVKDGYDGDESASGDQWSFSSAFLYSLTVITTIGYGNIAPRTMWGRLATIAYAIVGIPLMLLYLTNIGDVLAKMFKYVYARLCRCAVQDSSRQRRQAENYRARHIVAHNSPGKANAVGGNVVGGGGGGGVGIGVGVGLDPTTKEKQRAVHEDEVHIEDIPGAVIGPGLNDDEDDYGGGPDANKPHVTVPIPICLFILVLYICGGGLLFSGWEPWSFLDGSYFCFVTLTTIGFGDLVPGDSITEKEGESQGKLVLCSLYVLVGMALIAMCFNLMQEEVIHKVRACGARIGIIRERDDDDD